MNVSSENFGEIRQAQKEDGFDNQMNKSIWSLVFLGLDIRLM